jgi:hypothetical protein
VLLDESLLPERGREGGREAADRKSLRFMRTKGKIKNKKSQRDNLHIPGK